MKPRKNFLVKNQAGSNSQGEERLLLHSRTAGPSHINAKCVLPAGADTHIHTHPTGNSDQHRQTEHSYKHSSTGISMSPILSSCWHHRHMALFGLPHLPLSVFLYRYEQRSFSVTWPHKLQIGDKLDATFFFTI